jgi:hypothetical protein
MSLMDVFEKLDKAVCILVCTDKSLQDRLDAAVVEIVSLQERELPPDLRKEFNQLIEQIHAYRNSAEHSGLQQSDLALAILQIFKHFIGHTWISG